MQLWCQGVPPTHAQAKRRATASSAAAKQAALVAGGHASEDEEAPLVRSIAGVLCVRYFVENLGSDHHREVEAFVAVSGDQKINFMRSTAELA